MRDDEWLLRCVRWLRRTRNLAPAAVVASAELVRFRVRNGHAGNRGIISMVLRSPDEPGLLLGYRLTQHGTLVPKSVQRGVADVVGKLYTEQNAAEFDHPGRGLCFADVLSIARPRPSSPPQAALFQRLVTDRVRDVAPTFSHEPDRVGERLLKPVRQLIESVNDTLKGRLDLERHGGHTAEGVSARVARHMLAMAAAIWHNHRTGRPITRSLTAYDHEESLV